MSPSIKIQARAVNQIAASIMATISPVFNEIKMGFTPKAGEFLR